MSDYCECEKKPGGVLTVDDLDSLVHTVCGKKIGPMPKDIHKVKKPVYCAHRARRFGGEYVNFNHWHCDVCHTQWADGAQEPKDVVIAFVEA